VTLLALQPTAPTTLERTVAVVADVATIVIALALIAVGILVLYATRRAKRAIAGIRADLTPALGSLTRASEQVEAMSLLARTEVERVGTVVQAATEQVRTATERAADRLRDLDALLGVVQVEAEDTFVRTAAAVRGVQAGTRALRGLRAEPAPDGGRGGRDILD
jgi:hypothetical protein